jgi:hypothetical protein
MKNDEKYIADIYESIYKFDFFSQDIDADNFNWDVFFEKAAQLNSFSTLIESFELTSEIENSNGRIETYDIETLRGKKFKLVLDFYNKNKINYFIFAGIRAANFKNSPSSADFFEKLKDSIKDDEFLCFIRFEDEKGRSNLTSEVGPDSFELFTSLRNAVLKSFTKNKKWGQGKIFGLVFLINKSEKEKRVRIYKKLVSRYLPIFSNVHVDETSDVDFVHLIATK